MKLSTFGRKTGNWAGEMWHKLARTKQIGESTSILDTQLNRCLTTLDITLLGIGHMVGSGVYVLTSSVAKNIAGPAIVLAFVIAGFSSLLAALCYAEFSVRFPRAGSAYSYTYLALGEVWAFLVGWNMVLENVIGTAAVSRACSAYIDSLLGGVIRNYTLSSISSSIGLNSISEHVDIFAFIIVVVFMIFLTCGVRVTSYLNNLFSLINIGVILVIIVVGSYYSESKNWSEVPGGFMPYGWKGVFAASASCFYAYIGFDSIATSGEEAKDPQRSIPIATLISMAFATIAYMGVSTVLTLMVPYNQIMDESGLPDALGQHGAGWAKLVVICGACCGMVTVLVGTLYSLTRIVYAMADDGLLFAWMGTVNEKTQIPLLAMYFFASIGAVLALFLDITTLIEMMSIGTLMAYLVVGASVIVMRYQPQEPVRHSVSAEFNNQELNDLTTESPTNNEEQLIADDASIIGSGAKQFQSSIKTYISGSVLQAKVRQYSPDNMVTICVFVMTVLMFVLSFLGPDLLEASTDSGWSASMLVIIILLLVTSFLLITLHEQNSMALRYKVPLVPLVPTVSIAFNAALMSNLHKLTWLRLIIWIIAGFIVYFVYGIKHSRLDPESSRVKSNEVRNWGSLTDSACLPDNASTSSAY